MSDPMGNNFVFPTRSRGKHQDQRENKTNWFLEGPDIKCFVIFPDFHFNSNKRITGANQTSRLGTYNNTNLILKTTQLLIYKVLSLYYPYLFPPLAAVFLLGTSQRYNKTLIVRSLGKPVSFVFPRVLKFPETLQTLKKHTGRHFKDVGRQFKNVPPHFNGVPRHFKGVRHHFKRVPCHFKGVRLHLKGVAHRFVLVTAPYMLSLYSTYSKDITSSGCDETMQLQRLTVNFI